MKPVSLATKARTALALGPANLARVLAYRAALKLGIHPVQGLRAQLPTGPFFVAVDTGTLAESSPTSFNTSWWDEARYFGAHPVPCSESPPSWHDNPLGRTTVATPNLRWWQMSTFDAELGDIKTVWEASRFDWVLAFAQRARRGDTAALDRLNSWLADWCTENPAFCGPNWICGQEASIRVLHLLLAASILDVDTIPTPSLVELVQVHLRRIAPTMSYAIGQDNNHGSSEAAALFVGGSWLSSLADDPEATSWAETGRRWLEDRVGHLIDLDGTLSQYSVTYQRVVLDTLSLAEWWRRKLDLTTFSAAFYGRCVAATRWLHLLVQEVGGDAPNLGANDGARFFPLDDCVYRDFRPCVQLAATLFMDRCAYMGPGEWNTALSWLGLRPAAQMMDVPVSRKLDGGGLFILRSERAMALLRYPRFGFRPSQCDVLHVDLWLNGENLLRDGGSYSYAWPPEGLESYFPGTESHNTVQFDGREQMPRLGRFLWGDWLQVESCSELESSEDSQWAQASYQDRSGVRHSRRICLSAERLEVVDEISGFDDKAVLRWRLRPGNWQATATGARLDNHEISVSSSVGYPSIALRQGWESRHYLEKTVSPVLEIECEHPSVLRSVYRW